MALQASVPQLRRALSRYSFDPPAEPGYARETTVFPTLLEGAAIEGPAGISEAAGTSCSDAGSAPTWNGLSLAEDRAGAPAELSMCHDEWGRFTMRFNAPADVGALIEAALKEARDALFSATDTSAGARQVTLADAMVEIAGRSLGAVTSINRQNTFRTYIHLDTDGAWLTGQPRLPAHLAAKLTCDGILQAVWHTQGAPVNVGRAQRIVPPRTRRLVEDRDRGCRYPGCAATRHIECHHLIHWADGGPTDTFNLACLCSYHHDAHHDGDFTIYDDANHCDGLTFTTRGGFPIRPGPTFTTPINPPTPAPGSSGSPSPKLRGLWRSIRALTCVDRSEIASACRH